MFVRTLYGDPPYYMRGYADRTMELIHVTEHMWCRWCGGFGITDQMVCADSECLTQDMTQGALAGIVISGFKDTHTVQKIEIQATAYYGIMMTALESNASKTEALASFVNITAT